MINIFKITILITFYTLSVNQIIAKENIEINKLKDVQICETTKCDKFISSDDYEIIENPPLKIDGITAITKIFKVKKNIENSFTVKYFIPLEKIKMMFNIKLFIYKKPESAMHKRSMLESKPEWSESSISQDYKFVDDKIHYFNTLSGSNGDLIGFFGYYN